MTRIEVARAAGRARCAVEGDVLSPRVLSSDDDGARVALVAAGALLLGGDAVVIDVVVGAGAWLEVVETAGTVAYPGPTASWTVRARLGEGAVLVWEGLPFVVAQGADVQRCTTVALDAGARAVLRETIVLGRAGERGGAIRLRTDVTLAGRDLLVEDLDLSPSAREAPGVLGVGVSGVGVSGSGSPGTPGAGGAARVLDVVSAFGFRPDDAPWAAASTGVTHRFDLAGPGAVVRHLGMHAHASPLDGLAGVLAREALPRPSSR